MSIDDSWLSLYSPTNVLNLEDRSISQSPFLLEEEDILENPSESQFGRTKAEILNRKQVLDVFSLMDIDSSNQNTDNHIFSSDEILEKTPNLNENKMPFHWEMNPMIQNYDVNVMDRSNSHIYQKMEKHSPQRMLKDPIISPKNDNYTNYDPHYKERVIVRPQVKIMENEYLNKLMKKMETSQFCEEELKMSEKQEYISPKITKKDIQKTPYNFGKTAIGTYMRKLVKKGYYDRFLEKNLGRNHYFITGFKRFCQRISYSTIQDFKTVWIYDDEFSDNNSDDHYVALKKITQEFLRKDVFLWIEKRTKRKDYAPLYRKCVEIYRKGIENVEKFDLSEFF